MINTYIADRIFGYRLFFEDLGLCGYSYDVLGEVYSIGLSSTDQV